MPVKIIHINSQRRRLGLSARQAIEPGSYAGSFGDIDDHLPFATSDLASYQEPATPTAEDADSGVDTEAFTDVQDSPVAESEPQNQAAQTSQPVAVAPEEASPASEEAPSPDENQEPTVASATGQLASSE